MPCTCACCGRRTGRLRVRSPERGRSLEDVIGAETDKLTERALAMFGPAEREALIRALTVIRRDLAV